MNAYGLPLLNTVILILSGVSITIVHNYILGLEFIYNKTSPLSGDSFSN
jgi:hypothetical protein